MGGAWRILFCATTGDHGAARLARGVVAQTGTHYLTSEAMLGPLRAGRRRLHGRATRSVAATRAGCCVIAGAGWFFAWLLHDERGAFVGELSDPMAVTVQRDGSLRVDAQDGRP